MKALPGIVIMFFALLTTSCKKGYVCECTSNTGRTVYSSSYRNMEITKKEARKDCDVMKMSYTDTVTCAVK